MKTADLVGGGVGVGLGVYVLYEGAKMPADHIMKIGPNFFPDLLAWGLILFSALLVIYALLGRSKGSAEALDLRAAGLQRAAVSVLAVLLYAYALIPVGYPVATVLLISAIMVILGQRNVLRIGFIATVGTTVIGLVFTKLLALSLPMGLLEDFL